MKWKLPIALLTGVVTAMAFIVPPPDDWSDRIVKALEQFVKRYPQEKVYLHMDKDYYAAGETIWFRAYITLQGLPSTQATNLYVELLDKNNNIIQKKLFASGGGMSPGAFELPETQKPGTYQIRAYTAWMNNFDPAFFFTKNFEIFDPAKKAVPEADSLAQDFSVQFFPEGGNAIVGQAATVAFKAIDQNGYPIEVTGTVKSSKGDQTAAIKSVHDGMGSFDYTPAAGEKYQAVVKSAKGQSKTIDLPAAQSKGVTLKVYNKGARIFYQAVAGPDNDTSMNQLLVLAQMNQQMVYKANLDVADGRISGFIPATNIPSGIVQISLFTKSGLPVAQRLVFVKKNDLLQMDVLESDIHTEARTKNTLVLRLPDTINTSISVSITDAEAVPVETKNVNNIISNLLLTSDIKGFVYNPAWYFRNDSAQTLQALDLVMLTNGWTRFSWEKILNNEYPQIKYPYEQGLSMDGKAMSGTGRPLTTGGQIDMIIKVPADSSSLFAQAPVDDKGEFHISGMVFPDTAYIYYQGNDVAKKNKDVSVKFTNHFFEKPSLIKIPAPLRVPPPVDNTALKAFLANAAESNKVNRAINNKMVYLKEVNVNAKKEKPQETTEKRYVSGMFAGGDGITFDLTKETPIAMNVFQYLQSKVAGLQITGDINNPSISWRGGAPGLYLNEMQTDISMLSSLPVTDIALIKVIRPPFMGIGGANGAIAIYTKKGGDNVPQNDPSIRGFELYKKAGYAIVKQFYSPDYSVKKEVHSLPDKRLTLYWNPNVTVDTLTHTANIEFYNNDFTKKFRMVVEGMAEDGSVGHLEQEF
ncbi:MG2 domain-containing protein [Chitinophaga jiangningensis]|uniref:MG2 domain-containing protein n=1 Tax=Chitinophaga jiangningensis TaxID=1419482 RepID=A0A1M7C839_9BACT|nr:MG2 domain-containing protein [Chitinophaga jiangningensis]SHL63337.1 MG2 domain-containing protein [Chitinophaga jiangningensis]